MSILSKLIKSIIGGAEQSAQNTVSPKPARPSAEPVPTDPTSYPHGDSWGEFMPDEPNQYNYPGDYRAYFTDIFRTEFADCTVDRQDLDRNNASVFVLYRGGQRALVVEVLSRTSGAYKLREDCRQSGTPYLRFYHNYHGWWNTRSYVIRRCRAAMNGR